MIGRFVGALLCDWTRGKGCSTVIGRVENGRSMSIKSEGRWWEVLCCDWSCRIGEEPGRDDRVSVVGVLK